MKERTLGTKFKKKRVTASESSSFSSDRFFMKMSPRYRLRIKNKSVLGYELLNFFDSFNDPKKHVLSYASRIRQTGEEKSLGTNEFAACDWLIAFPCNFPSKNVLKKRYEVIARKNLSI